MKTVRTIAVLAASAGLALLVGCGSTAAPAQTTEVPTSAVATSASPVLRSGADLLTVDAGQAPAAIAAGLRPNRPTWNPDGVTAVKAAYGVYFVALHGAAPGYVDPRGITEVWTVDSLTNPTVIEAVSTYARNDSTWPTSRYRGGRPQRGRCVRRDRGVTMTSHRTTVLGVGLVVAFALAGCANGTPTATSTPVYAMPSGAGGPVPTTAAVPTGYARPTNEQADALFGVFLTIDPRMAWSQDHYIRHSTYVCMAVQGTSPTGDTALTGAALLDKVKSEFTGAGTSGNMPSITDVQAQQILDAIEASYCH